MAKLWLVKGRFDAPGWDTLRDESKERRADIVHLDPRVWALMKADQPPSGYEGLTAHEPPDGLYLDPNGSPLYLVNREIVPSARDVIEALGEEARDLLDKVGDADMVLDRLGRSY